MQLDARMQRFLDSLGDDLPGEDLSPPLRGCWWALRGDWQAAHDEIQGGSRAEAWVHAALHREEGDHANATYWYGRAERQAGVGAARREYLAIAAELLA
ncbi:MAG: hypothetical protein VYD05_08945 [Planctomycetota bacterium]|nr:hypothetical protein [Planctomycetota bacterium]